MPSYAGVNLLQSTPQIADWVARTIPLSDVIEFQCAARLNKLDIRLPYEAAPLRPIKLGSLFWPVGGSRFACAHFLVTEAQLTIIRAAGGGTSAQPFVMTDGINTITTNLFLLPPRPLCQQPQDQPHFTAYTLPAADFKQHYLLTLVDERYFWGDRGAAITVTEDPDELTEDTVGESIESCATWLELFSAIGTGLRITLTPDTINSAYLRPPASLSAYQENLAILLDVCAWSVGHRVVRNFDGTVVTQSATTAQAQVATQLAANVTNRLAGGLHALEPGAISDLAPITPGTVRVVFPATIADQIQANPVTFADVSLGSLALAEYAGVPTTSNLKIIKSSAVAAYAPDVNTLTNQTELVALSKQIATDWYRWQLAKLDSVFGGICNWAPEGLHDIEWTHHGLAGDGTSKLSTRVQRGEWNTYPDLMHAGTPYNIGKRTGQLGSLTNWRLYDNVNNSTIGNLWIRQDLVYSGGNFTLQHLARAYISDIPAPNITVSVDGMSISGTGTLDLWSDNVVLLPGPYPTGDRFLYNHPTVLPNVGVRENGLYTLVKDGKDNAAYLDDGTGQDAYYDDGVGADIYDDSGGSWLAVRPPDADTSSKCRAGMQVLVTEGDNNADTEWELITDDVIVLGTTALAFVTDMMRWVQITSIYPLVNGFYPGFWYDSDLAIKHAINVDDANDLIPAVGTFYMGRRATDLTGGTPVPIYEIADQRKIKGKLSGILNQGASATMRIWDVVGGVETDMGVDVIVWDWLLAAAGSIASGVQVTAFWRGRWYVDGATC